MANLKLKLLEHGIDREGLNYKLYQGSSKKHCLLICFIENEDSPGLILRGDYEYCKKWI